VSTNHEVARRPAELVLVTGLQGTGKSTIADSIADALAAPVFGWDWCMAALTPFESVQAALRSLDAPTYRAVGWALVLQAGRAHLRRGLPVVLDGMARDDEVRAVRALGQECRARTLVVLTTCDDPQVRRSRIEGRSRGIPGWHELTWEEVERSRERWTQPVDVDVVLDSSVPVEDLVHDVLGRLEG
jgi:predicted kinase